MKTKIQQILGIITADKPVNYSQYSGQLFEYSEFENSINTNMNTIIRAQLFEYSNNPSIRGNTEMDIASNHHQAI